MTPDTKQSLPPFSAEEELDIPPPSYDSALATSTTNQPDAGSSTSRPAEERVIPHHLLHLFSGPPNGEPPIGRDYVPPEQIKKISWQQKGLVIESSDPQLSDPNVMYDFIRAQSMVPPTSKIRCKGAHLEISQIEQHVIEDGVRTFKRKGESYQAIDFDFTIDLTEIIHHPSNRNNVHLRSISSFAPTIRGLHDLRYGASYAPDARTSPRHGGYEPVDSDAQYGATDIGRKATAPELSENEAWNTFRLKKGIPGWVKMQDIPEFWDTRPGSKLPSISLDSDAESARSGIDDYPSLRQWCQVYCKDSGIFKEFWMYKGLYGWDIENLQNAIKNAILSTGYQSNYLTVTSEVTPPAVVIRPNNIFSRAINHGFIYFLSWITLIWPMIWILKRVFPRFLGAPWGVAYVNYGLKCYPALPSTYPMETISQAQDRLPSLYKFHPELPKNPTLQYGPKGVHYLLGRKEGEWFREWEERIRMGVRMKHRGELQGGVVGDTNVGVGLDGY
ncbi:uncharacterized protein IL334_005844 [Kwoniella shivajii]|uniref:Uncharacterized protein n=1 Tax=Kwoniella shivajii TaxID=564305 RepID=A0ABZ1D4Y2_9TREE|nr:hypothetical protein IL334_005844 [Kwoniella shivajii]